MTSPNKRLAATCILLVLCAVSAAAGGRREPPPPPPPPSETPDEGSQETVAIRGTHSQDTILLLRHELLKSGTHRCARVVMQWYVSGSTVAEYRSGTWRYANVSNISWTPDIWSVFDVGFFTAAWASPAPIAKGRVLSGGVGVEWKVGDSLPWVDVGLAGSMIQAQVKFSISGSEHQVSVNRINKELN